MVSVVIIFFFLIHKHIHVYILVNWWSQYRGSIGWTIYKTTPFKEQFNIKYGSSNRNCLFERCKYKEIDNSKSSGSDWKVYSLDTGLLCIVPHYALTDNKLYMKTLLSMGFFFFNLIAFKKIKFSEGKIW